MFKDHLKIGNSTQMVFRVFIFEFFNNSPKNTYEKMLRMSVFIDFGCHSENMINNIQNFQ